MAYKVCTRCQFIVPDKKKICTTCGSKMARAASVTVAPDVHCASVSVDLGANRKMSALREKLNLADEQMPTLWWMETVTRVRRALNI